MSVCDRVILWGSRVIVPPKVQERVLEELHSTHPGVNRMKSITRSYVWWPGMDAEIENRVKVCHSCQENVNSPAKAPVHLWEWPERAWSHVRIDYPGPFEGRMFLVVIDAYSKWIEVVPVRHATSQSTMTNFKLSSLCMVFPKCWCQTTVHRSPVLNFKSLSTEMLFIMFKLLRIIRLPMDSPRERSKHLSPL